MYPTHMPIRISTPTIASYGIPILDEDFDPSDPLLPQDIDMTDDNGNYDYSNE
jgi:hypothetical protein